ncbi:MAG: PAS domain S-box protein [Chlorobi bacterium]|nr:PAS domain S-box protein [Chlorobiota bacterium]
MNSETKNIYIVDDIYENLEVLSDMLKQEGMNVSLTQSGIHALQIIPDEKPDLVLLDLFMPEVDGYEVCRKLKANPETTDIPVIFLTAGTEPEYLIEGFKAGAVDYITKPFNSKELITRINNHIELKKAKDIIRKQNKELKKVNKELDKTNIELIKSGVQLTVSEAKFKKLFEQSNDGIIIHTSTGKILDANKEACRMLQYSKKEMLNNPLLSFFYKNTLRKTVKSFIRIRKLGTYRFETKLKRADNKIIDIESSSKVIDEENEIVQSIFRDITESNKIKSDLKKSERYFRKIYDNTPYSILTINSNGTIVDANLVTLYIFKLSGFNEIINQNIQDFSFIAKTDFINDFYDSVENATEFNKEYNFSNKQNESFWVNSYFIPIKNYENKVISNYVIIENVTERKNASIALKNSEDKFKKLSNLTFEGILIHEKGIAIDLNLSFANMTGYTNNELVGKNILNLLIPEEYHTYIKQKIDTAYINTYEYEIVKKNGIRIPVETESRNIIYNGRKVRVTAFRDITERKKNELALIESKSKLKEAQKIAKLGHWHFNIRENKLEWSDEVYRIFEVSPNEFSNTYEAFLSLIHPNDINHVNKAYSESVKNKTEFHIIHRLLLKNGNIKYIEEKGNTTYNVNGKPIESIGICLDVTKQKKAEKLLQLQKEELEDNNKSIISSISYARVIQNAVLPTESFLKQFLPESFVFFMPRDIVSGDFYWIKQVQHKIFIGVADCTGHGVPGAFMSMLGMTLLSEIVSPANDADSYKANHVLNDLRKKLKLALHQDRRKDTASDGMDIALCIIDLEHKKMQYAGANNPLYLIRNNYSEPELIQYKADRMPIGVHLKEKSFSNHEIDLQANDLLYIFSDGFVDQFGGVDGRKYRSNRFKEFLLANCTKPIVKQKKLLQNEFEEWRGNERQVDDVLILGMKIHESYGDVDLF